MESGRSDHAESNGPGRAQRLRLSRRGFLRLMGAGVAAGVGGGLYSFGVEPRWIEVVRRPLPIAHLPPALAGRTLALISDIHVSDVVGDDYLRAAMDRLNGLRPDLVAVAGDLMSCRFGEQIERTARVFSRLARPPLGIVCILGNHDYAHGYSNAAVADALTERLGAAGVRVLRNELTVIEGLQIAGLDDYWAKRFGPERVLPKLDPAAAAVVLSHNPDTVDLDGWGDYRGWVLCGHTHGGQVSLPLIGPPILPVANRNYVAGEVDAGHGRRLYITRGLGHLLGVRFRCRPEITLFELASRNR